MTNRQGQHSYVQTTRKLASLERNVEPSTTSSCALILKLSVGSGIEVMVSKHVRPIRTVHFDDPTD
jgi:hypothetical protein